MVTFDEESIIRDLWYMLPYDPGKSKQLLEDMQVCVETGDWPVPPRKRDVDIFLGILDRIYNPLKYSSYRRRSRRYAKHTLDVLHTCLRNTLAQRCRAGRSVLPQYLDALQVLPVKCPGRPPVEQDYRGCLEKHLDRAVQKGTAKDLFLVLTKGTGEDSLEDVLHEIMGRPGGKAMLKALLDYMMGLKEERFVPRNHSVRLFAHTAWLLSVSPARLAIKRGLKLPAFWKYVMDRAMKARDYDRVLEVLEGLLDVFGNDKEAMENWLSRVLSWLWMTPFMQEPPETYRMRFFSAWLRFDPGFYHAKTALLAADDMGLDLHAWAESEKSTFLAWLKDRPLDAGTGAVLQILHAFSGDFEGMVKTFDLPLKVVKLVGLPLFLLGVCAKAGIEPEPDWQISRVVQNNIDGYFLYVEYPRFISRVPTHEVYYAAMEYFSKYPPDGLTVTSGLSVLQDRALEYAKQVTGSKRRDIYWDAASVIVAVMEAWVLHARFDRARYLQDRAMEALRRYPAMIREIKECIRESSMFEE